MKPWFVYVVECSDRTLYTGITTDVQVRIQAHSAGRGAKYTRGRGPVVLKWQSPPGTRREAAQLEVAIKRLPRAKKVSLFCKNGR